MQTNYKFNKRGKFGVIITHGLLSNIEKKSIKMIEEIFQKNHISTLSFDIYGHGKSEGKIEDLTLSKCYLQLEKMNEIFIRNGIICRYLYGTSFSTLAILKFGNNLKDIKNIFLKTPVFDYLVKRKEELGEKNMKIWKEKGIIKIIDGFNGKPDIYQKYEFIKDCKKNFTKLVQKNTKNLFIGAGVFDEEVDINILENLQNQKIILEKFYDGHRFSEKNMKLFCKKIDKFLC